MEIPRLRHDRRHIGRHRHRVDVLGQCGAADVAALRLRHLAGDVGKHQRMPVLVEIFVRDVACVLLPDVLQSGLEGRIGLKEQCAGLFQPVDEIQHAGNSEIGSFGAGSSHHAHQCLHRHHRGPPGGDVVAEIDQAARLQPSGDHRHQMVAVGRRDPAQHTMRDHEIVFGSALSGNAARPANDVSTKCTLVSRRGLPANWANSICAGLKSKPQTSA